MNRFLTIGLLGLLCLSGCGRRYPGENKEDTGERERLLNVNRAVVHDEARLIQEFISRHGWKMKMTGTGLHYDIYDEGSGPKPGESSVLTISYKVYLLDGTLCYEADEQHPQKLVTGKGQQINGLEEGLKMMNEGARARFVIPNHLAYGITGDQDKIPPASALFYDVHLIKSEIPEKQ